MSLVKSLTVLGEGEKFARFVPNILTAGECKEWISFAESKGFAPASLLSDQTKEWKIKNFWTLCPNKAQFYYSNTK